MTKITFRKIIKFAVLVGTPALLIVCGFFLLSSHDSSQVTTVSGKHLSRKSSSRPLAKSRTPETPPFAHAGEGSDSKANQANKLTPNDEGPEEDDGSSDVEQRLVDAFDNLTDTWQEPAPKGVSLEDVEHFRNQFNQIPSAHKEECLQRALNLIPDANVELLGGILFDKSQDKELIELVYNDILNRDEIVKKPLLQLLYKDKNHPCWADTAWILDVTDDLPNKGKGERK